MARHLPSAADKPRYVADLFGRIAWRYDLMNTLLSGGLDRRWRAHVARLVAETASRSGRPRILDVGTGTGKLARAIEQAAPGATVIGVDFAQAMLRAAGSPLTGASADSLRLPFADASFDAVVSAFLVRNLADAEAGLVESIRVLRAGGRLLILETTPGPPGLLRAPYRLYFRSIAPLLGGLIAGDPSAYTYLPESTLAFLEPARLADLLRQLGLQNVTSTPLTLGTVAVTVGTRS